MNIYSELEDMNDVTFINRGKVGVGYLINMKERYPLELSGGQIIGSFEVGFDLRSQYIYKAITDVEGYFIRKSDWKMLETKHPFFYDFLFKKLIIIFYTLIRPKMTEAKEKDIQHFKRRSDHTQFCMVTD